MFRFVVLSALLACAFGAAVPGGLAPLWEARIVGGKETTIESYPYTVSMKYGGSHRCGGSIYRPDVIISAAHCVQGVSASNLAITAGTSYRTSGGVTKKVSKIIIHEKYSSSTVDNDVAILFLEEGFELGESIQTINLASAGSVVEAGVKATCSGWGALKEGGASPSVLQFVDVSVVNNADCGAAYGKGSITDAMMCAGEKQGGKDACQGDSGGPLAVGNTLVGIVSWGYGCARAGYPGVYSSVGYLRSWIDSKL